jgi:L-malate glycosyltransferase
MRRLLRLLYIANPNSTHTRRWLNWFSRRGHSVALVADVTLAAPWEGVQVFDLAGQFNLRVVRYLVWEIQLRRIVRSWHPHLLHAQRVSSAGWLGAFANFHPLVVTPWGSDLYQHVYRSRVARALSQFTLRRSDLVTADSQDLCRQAILFGAQPERTKLALWGVDTQVFKPGKISSTWRERLNLGSGPVILSPRGVNRIYHLEAILAAVGNLKPAYPELTLLLRAYNVDPVYKNELDRMAREKGLASSVRWIPAIEPYENLVEVYRLADLVVSVPDSDGTPVSVLEAMACGVPVIASDLPSLREWITDGQNGLIIPPGDADALAKAISRLLADRDLMVAFSGYNLQLVKSKAEHEQEMLKIEGYYQELVG